MTASPGHDVTLLGGVANLFSALRQDGVRFCHWKSNAHIAGAVQGETDLDLLVDRRQAGRFRTIIDEHDFKPLIAAPGKHYPAVENYLGFDRVSGRLIHLHVHYQLVLGQQFVKDYRLPIEDWILDSVYHIGDVPVPAPEVELTILAMRVTLKYRLRDAFKDATGFRSPGVPARVREEIDWLLSQAELDEVIRSVADMQELPSSVVAILETLMSDRPVGLALLRLRQRLRSELRSFRRISRIRSTWDYASAVGRKRSRALGVGEKHRMTLRNGGITIGFVGADGAGKSTIIGAIHDWLSWRLEVSTAYMGTSNPDGTVRVLKEVAGIARAANRRITESTGGRGAIAAAVRNLSLGLTGLRRLIEVRSKRSRLLLAGDASARGSIVLFDRFPLSDVFVNGRPMDGPRLHQEIGESDSRLLRRMVDRESAEYREILSPERLIALKVSPGVSLTRKPDHDPAAIEAKSRAIETLSGHPGSFVVIDADRPLEQVIDDVKAIVWNWL